MTNTPPSSATLTTAEAEPGPPAFMVGDIPIRNRVLCAPICGATKIPYRRLVSRYGADLTWTEMIKAEALVRHTPKSFELAKIDEGETPVGAQICGADPEKMATSARMLRELGFHTIDINMGCPVPRVVKEGAGAALMKSPELVEKVVRACVDAVDVPVTIKIRSGWTKDQANAVDVSRAAEQGGAQMVSIHGRARSQRHQGDLDFGKMAAVKHAVSIPVVGNGGIFAPQDAVRMIRETGCDAVMIARGGYGRPWFFRDVARAIKGLEPGPEPDAEELGGILRMHLRRTVEILGEPIGVRSFRKICSWYFKDKPYGTYFRDMAFRATLESQLAEVVEAWIEHYHVCRDYTGGHDRPPPPEIVKQLMDGPRADWMDRPARRQEREPIDPLKAKTCAEL